HAAARLVGYELAAILRFADDFVACGQVQQHRSPVQRLHGAGGDRHPQILTDLDTDEQAVHVHGVEEQLAAEGDFNTAEDDAPAAAASGSGEPSALVKLLVVRNERLGHGAEQLAAVEDRGAVEELIVHDDGQADGSEPGENDAAILDEFQQGVE